MRVYQCLIMREISLVMIISFGILSSFLFPRCSNADDSVKIFDSVAGGRPYTTDGPRATFLKGNNKWTIIGSHAPIVTPTLRPRSWPIKDNSFEIIVVKNPITNKQILPYTVSIANAQNSGVLSIKGCPGEYEPASFVIRSGDLSLKDVVVSVSDLTISSSDKSHTLSRHNVDVGVVKCWYQAGRDLSVHKGMRKVLTPELILKDDSLVEVNYQHQVNLIKNLDTLKDARSLKPFDVDVRENKQIWLTISIPASARPGLYKGTVSIAPQNSTEKHFPLQLEILPFRLEKPLIKYSMFYNADLPKPGETFSLSSRKRPLDRMLIELKDMKEHGIDNPTLDQREWNPTVLSKILSLRTAAGISNDVIYYVAWPAFKPGEPVYMAKVSSHCKKAVAFLKDHGSGSVFFYGFDELDRRKTPLALPLYKNFHQMGAKTFVAGADDFFQGLFPFLDIAIIWGAGGQIKQEKLINLAKLVHIAQKEAWIYSFPQCGQEEPETYRRNFGLLLWKLGFDGSCNFSYQGGMNHYWDDFDHPTFRDELMTYPTVDGIISTLQWEGWREGIKDIRYLSTLLRLRKSLLSPKLSAEIDECISTIELQDLSQTREKIIQLIIKIIAHPTSSSLSNHS